MLLLRQISSSGETALTCGFVDFEDVAGDEVLSQALIPLQLFSLPLRASLGAFETLPFLRNQSSSSRRMSR